MLLSFTVALAAGAAAPMAYSAAAPAQAPAAISAPKVSDKPVVKGPGKPPATAAKPAPLDPAKAMEVMTKLLDKLMPAGPDPEPARLAAARITVATMFPNGAYAKGISGFANGMIDRVLDMSEADLAALAEAAPGDKKKKDKAPSTVPLRRQLAASEPNFDAKLAAVRAFMEQTMIKLGSAAEPKFRDGMARALARKFDAAQLAEIDAFLATPTGNSYGREMVGLWFQPDVLRGAVAVVPEMIALMPEVLSDGAALGEQIKALDKGKGGKPSPTS